MRTIWIPFIPLFFAGCATQRPAVLTSRTIQPTVAAAELPTKQVETRYEVRSYREITDPSVRHEAHAIYRTTRVPISACEELTTVPRDAYSPASYAPQPASEELAAELRTQKKITTDIRSMQASIAQTDEHMQAQYATLVRESAKVLKTEEALAAERQRLHAATPTESTATTANSETTHSTEAKW